MCLSNVVVNQIRYAVKGVALLASRVSERVCVMPPATRADTGRGFDMANPQLGNRLLKGEKIIIRGMCISGPHVVGWRGVCRVKNDSDTSPGRADK